MKIELTFTKLTQVSRVLKKITATSKRERYIVDTHGFKTDGDAIDAMKQQVFGIDSNEYAIVGQNIIN